MHRSPAFLAFIAFVTASLGACGRDAPSKMSPPSNAAAAAGGAAPAAPLAGMTLELDGFDPVKSDPSQQVKAHEYCRRVNGDFAQCAIFDGGKAEARLIGVEYIISAQRFASLPEKERRYWHPHNGEILSGELVAPGLKERADTDVMRSLMNTYGKTWLLWRADRGDTLPLGDPTLAWSFTHDAEADAGPVAERDLKLGSTAIDRRRARTELVPLAKPQEGVDALRKRYPRETADIPGVVDSGAAAAKR